MATTPELAWGLTRLATLSTSGRPFHREALHAPPGKDTGPGRPLLSSCSSPGRRCHSLSPQRRAAVTHPQLLQWPVSLLSLWAADGGRGTLALVAQFGDKRG